MIAGMAEGLKICALESAPPPLLVEIGLTGLPKSAGGRAPPCSPVPPSLDRVSNQRLFTPGPSSMYTYLLDGQVCIKFCVKVNSVQEACAKCFVVHILKFEILQIT